MRLLAELRRESGLTLMFVSHNLALVRRLCERVLVLYLGRMMELAPARELYERPGHPYTRELLAAIPSPDPDVQPARLAGVRGGEPPSPLEPPSGCVYRTRCPYVAEVCQRARAGLRGVGHGAPDRLPPLPRAALDTSPGRCSTPRQAVPARWSAPQRAPAE